MKTCLNNGLTVILHENHASPLVAIQMWVNSGSADETSQQAGLAHLKEHMFFKGTQKRKSGKIARDIQGCGGEINAFTNHDNTVYHMVIAKDFFNVGIDVMADAIHDTTVSEIDLSREIKVIVDEETKRAYDNPLQRLKEELFTLAYDIHPYRRSVIGYEALIRSFTPENIREFYKAHYRPDNMALIVVGDFCKDKAYEKIKSVFDVNCSSIYFNKKNTRIKEPEQKHLKIKIVRTKVSESYFSLGFKISNLVHEDVPALDLLGVILGQGESSRLVQSLQMKNSFVTGVEAYAYTPKDDGLFTINALLHTDRLYIAISALMKEIIALTVEQVCASELEKARNMILSDSLFSLETVQGQARRYGYFESLAGDTNYYNQYNKILKNVTPEDIYRVATKYLVLNHLSFVALVPENCDKSIDEIKLARLMKKMERKTKHAAVKGKFRRGRDEKEGTIICRMLDNGMKVIMRKESRTPIVAVRAAVLGGVLDETVETNGIHCLMSRMLTRGTVNHSADELIKEIDMISGYIGGFAGRNSLGLFGEFLSKNFDQGLKIFLESLAQPALSEEDLCHEKKRLIDDIHARKDNIPGLAYDLFLRTHYNNHPYRLPIVGNESCIKRITQNDLKNKHKTLFHPSQIVLGIVGNFDSRNAIDQIMKSVEGIGHIQKSFKLPPEDSKRDHRQISYKFHNKKQVHLIFGFKGMKVDDRDRFGMDLLISMLSGQSGRLFMELRDKRSLAYTVSANSFEGLSPGYLSIYMGTSQEKIEQSVDGIINILDKIKNEGISNEELDRQKRYVIGSHAIGLQRSAGRAALLTFNKLYNVSFKEYDQYMNHVQGITCCDIQKLANKYFTFDNYTLAMLCPYGAKVPEKICQQKIKSNYL